MEGRTETLPVGRVPRSALRLALAATRSIGDGFYGVDLKEARGKFHVIEVNDHPSVDAGVEDRVLGDALYDRVMGSFRRRLERLRLARRET